MASGIENNKGHDHYRNHPMLIVRLSAVSPADLRELLTSTWQIASS
ncbi:MAG TPA: hypothetical protein VGH74_07240 [Planctomycetaceae bacterium]